MYDTGNIRTQPKFMVFISQLLLLFQFCPYCKQDNPHVETRKVGTMASLKCTCTNPGCEKVFIWKSQPFMPGTFIPAGNFLLCFGILLAGSSASKVFNIFNHMGHCCISLNTYFRQQRVSRCHYYLIPRVLGTNLSVQ